MLRCLDLCAGTGSATAPFAAAGWLVTSVDVDPHWHPTILGDVRELHFPRGSFDVVWTSPPCTQFSRLDQRGLFPNDGPPDLSLVLACKRIIEEIAPRVWWVENVRGARRYLADALGPPATHLGPWWLWTNSVFLPALAERPTKRMSGYRKGHTHKAVRLAVHPGVAQAVYHATAASLGLYL